MHPDPERSGWAKLTDVVMRRAGLVAIGVTVLLGALAIPTLGLRYGVDTGSGAVGDSPAGRGFAAISASFAPGMTAPVSVVVSTGGGRLSDAHLAAIATFTERVSGDGRVAGVSSVTTMLDRNLSGHGADRLGLALAQVPEAFETLVSNDVATTVVTVYPAQAADSDQTLSLVTDLRQDAAQVLRDARLVAHGAGTTLSSPT